MARHTDGFGGSTFETLESRVMLTGAFPAAAQNAIVYDSQGNLDVAYYDSTAHNLKYVQQNTAGVWSQPVTIDGSSSDVGKYLAIALNSQGLPAVAYQDSANANLKFAQSNGSTWNVAVVDKRKSTGFNPSLTFNSAGVPFISYYKQNTGDLDLATFAKNKWTVTVLASAGNVGQFSSVAINPATGKPAVAFSNAGGSVQYVAQGAGKAFAKPVTVAKVTKKTTGTVSLAFDGNGAAVGYVDAGSGAVALGQISGKKFATTPIANAVAGDAGAQVLIDPNTHQASVVYHDSTGVYLAAPSTDDGIFQTTQVATGGSNTIATVQPGTGTIVYSSVDTTGGTLSVNTTSAAPAAPTNIAAVSDSTSSATITWSDNSTTEAGFLIERSLDGLTFATVATTQSNVTSFSDDGLTEGTDYYYRVSAVGAAGSNTIGTTDDGSQGAAGDTLAAVTTFPAAPSAILASPASDTSINVAWTNASHLLSGFVINRSSDGGANWSQIATVDSTTSTYADSGLTEGTAYQYVVIAYNGAGGTNSAVVATDTRPAAPTAVSAVPASTTSLTVSWTNNAAAAASGFVIQRSTDGTNYQDLITVGASPSSYTDTGLTEGTAYYYQIEAIGPGGFDSAVSASANAVTNPNTPSNLSAAAQSTTRIDLTWTNNSASAGGYTLQRSTNGADFVSIANLTGGATTHYSDTGLFEGSNYIYRVQAVDGRSNSDYSAPVSAITLPSAPTALSALAGGSSVTLTWNDNSVSETRFEVQRSGDNGNSWMTLTPAPANPSATATYIDSTVGEGATYLYRVKAVNGAGSSTFSNTPAATIAPAAPGGLAAAAISATAINLTWADHSAGETGIYIERSTNGTDWQPVTTTSAFAQSDTDTGLSAGTTYQYRISAINLGGASTYATATGQTAPAAPAVPNTVVASTTEIDLTWSPVSSAASYLVSRTVNGVTTTLGPVGTASFADIGLTEGTQYQYAVTAINGGGTSAAGTSASATTLPAAPIAVSASPFTATGVLVSWTNVSQGYTGLLVERSADNGQSWSIVGHPAPGQNSVTDTSVLEAHTYIYHVQASNAGGPSSFAVSSAVTTVPATPTNLTAAAANTGDVALVWSNNSQGASSYLVQRGTDGENFGTIVTVDGSSNAATDTTAAAATTYYYRVYAMGQGGPSDYSNISQAITLTTAPQNVTATAVNATNVTVSWSPVAGASEYNILRSTDGQNFFPYDTSTTAGYSDTGAAESTQYSYEVEAVNAGGASANSAPSTPVTTVPSAPTSPTVISSAANQVVVGWQNSSHAVTGFSIERSDDNGISFSGVGTALSSAVSYADSVDEGSHYIYRVRATGPGGASAPSVAVGADTNPAGPTGVTTTAASDTSITVSWSNVSAHATGYVVSRSDNGGAFSVVATVDSTTSSITDAVLQDGSYQYQVRAVQLLSDNVTTLNSTWAGPQTVASPAAAPNNVTATVISADEVDVAWENNSSTATGFDILRSNGSGGWAPIGSVDVGLSAFADTTAAAGTIYSYEVIAVGVNADSAPAVSSPLTSIPATPADLSAVNTANPLIIVSWSDVSGETGFHLQRNNGNGWTDLADVDSGTTQYSDTVAVEDTSYQYRILASNGSGSSAYSDPASVSTFLSPPKQVTVTGATFGEVDLSWTDQSSSATGYEVQRSADGGAWESLAASLGANADSFQDTTVADGVQYTYQVRALSAGGNSDFVLTGSTITPLLAPTGLAATSVSTSRVDLSWNNPSASASGFQVWRSVNGGGFSSYDAVDGSTTSYTDTSLTEGQSVQYEIVATSAATTSEPSAPVTAYALAAGPTNLNASPLSETSMSLTWTDQSTGATGYQIYRDSGLGFALLTTVNGVSANSYTDTGLAEGSTYSYKVFAVNPGGDSSASNVITKTTYATGPTNLTVASVTTSSIALNWNDTSAHADGYVVAISSDGGHSFNPIQDSLNLGANATTYTVTDLDEATAYQIVVYAVNAAGSSTTTNTVAPTTLAAAPTLGSVAAEADGVHIAWTDNSAGATGYIVQRSSNGGGTYDQNFNVDLGTTTFVDTSAAANTGYTYQIIATDAGGNSNPSGNNTALTLPVAPTNLAAVSTTSSSATLTWTPDADGAGGYSVDRYDGNGWSNVGTPGGTDSTFTDTSAAAGTSYIYRLTANNATGSAEPMTSSLVAILTAAPTGLISSGTTDTTVALQWNDVRGETGFVLQRSADGTDGWQTIDTPEAGQTSGIDTAATEAATFYYRVAASDGSGTGDFSASYGVLTRPAAGTALIASPVSTTQVNLSWTDHSHAESGYDIYRAANGGGDVLLVHALTAGTTSYQDTTASAGFSYVYNVYAYNDSGPSAAASQAALTVPGQPQSFAASAPSASEIDLTWNAVFGATQFTVMRSPDGSTQWTQVAQVGGDTLSFNDTAVAEGTTYYYTVTAGNATGAGTAAAASAPTLPAGIISLNVSASSATAVHLSWTDNSVGATGYHVYRQTNNAGQFQLVDSITDSSVTTFDDSVSEGTTYTYRVQPVDASGEGAATDISITTVPAAPTLASATPASNTTVNLTFSNNSSSAIGFTVERAPLGTSDWTTLSSDLPNSAGTYADTTAAGGTNYQFKIIAHGAGGNSADSNVIAATTFTDAVTTLAASSPSTSEIDLTWTAVNGATGYKIFRSTTNSNFTQFDTAGAAATSYADTTGVEATRYYYQVLAGDAAGDSAVGNTAFTSTRALAPSGLIATVGSNHEIDLSWTNNSANAASVGIERSLNGSAWTQIATTANGTINSYADTSVIGGTTYFYRVSAIDEGGTNYMSDVASVSKLTVPDAPVLTATAATDGTVALSWTAPTGATTFTVQHNSGGGWVNVVAGTSTTSTDDTGLAGNTTYQYRVLASNGSGDGANGSISSVLTVPTAPSALVATASGTSSIGLTWAGDSGANVKFSVYRAPVADGTTGSFAKIGSITGVLAYADSTLAPGTTYAYEVLASNSSGQNVTPALSSQVVTFPVAVGSLAETVISGTEVDLTWTPASGATSYTVSRIADGDSGYLLLTSTPLDANAGSYSDTTAVSGTSYTYQVTSTNAGGSSSATIAALTFPAGPSGFTVSVVDNHDISVQWNAVTGAASYTLQRSVNGGSWIDVVGVSGTSIADMVAAGNTYAYQVKASNATGDSAFATTGSVTTVPDAVTGFTAAATSDTSVHLAWSLSSGATSYVVERSDDNGANYTFTSDPLSAGTSSYDNTALSELSSYKYKVIASNGGGDSADSAVVPVVTLPTAPSDLHTTSISSSQVALAWTDHSNGDAGFDVQRLVNGVWITVDTTSAGTASYQESSLAAGTTYEYRVIADNGSVMSAPTAGLSVLTQAGVPTNIVASPISATEVDLTWDAMTGADNYDITYSVNGGAYNPLASAVSTNSYAFTAASGGTSYTFKIVANNASGAGNAGTSLAALTIPDAPTSIVATPISDTEVDLVWDMTSGADTYDITYSIDGGDYSPLISGVQTNSYAFTTASSATSYQFQIVADDATGSSTAGISNLAMTVPAAVRSITAVAASDSEIDLTWDADAGTVTGYRVMESTGGAFSEVGTDLPADATSFSVTALAAATRYEFQVLAVNATGTNAHQDGFTGEYWANNATRPDLIPGDVPPTFTQIDQTINIGSDDFENTPAMQSVPGAPQDFGVSDFVAEWDGKVSPSYSEQYTFYLSTDDGSRLLIDGVLVGDDNFSTIQGQTTEDCVVPYQFVAGQVYNVEVEYQQGGGGWDARLEWGSASQAREFVDPSASVAATTVPETPANFTATAASNSEIDLEWDSVDGATGYEVDRQNPDDSWTPLSSDIPSNAVVYQDTTVVGGTSFTYRVLALDAGGPSTTTDPVTALTKPDAPANVTATPSGTGEVDLSWDHVTGATNYDITYSVNGGTYNPLTTGDATTSYAFTSASAGTTYTFQIYANDTSGASEPATSGSALTIPDVPGGFAVNPMSAGHIDVSWTDVDGATNYVIERATEAGDYALLDTGPLGAGIQTYADTSVVGGTNYHYRIHASDATGDSATSSPQSALTVPAAIVLTSQTVVSDSEITLGWTAASGAVSGYRISRYDSNSGNFLQIGPDLPADTVSFDDMALASGTAYVYRVLAFNDTGESGNSDSNTLTTVPQTPGNFAAASVSNLEIDLSWTDVSGATGYQVERADGSDWSPIGGVLADNAVGYADTALASATQYTYRVEAIDDGGDSVPTAPQAQFTRPDAVQNLLAAAVSSSEVDLSWGPVAGATGYHVEQTVAGVTTDVDVTDTTYAQTSLSEDTQYTYDIVAFDDGGDAAGSAPQSPVTYLAAPDISSGGATTTSIDFTWTNHSLVDAAYKLEIETSPGVWADVHDGGALASDGGTDGATIAGLTEATTYQFRVTALDAGSGASLPTLITASTIPNTPSGIIAQEMGNTQVDLTWTNNSASADSIVVERSDNNGGTYAPIATLAGDATTYSDTEAAEGTTYQYLVVATKGSAVSPVDISGPTTTQPLPVTDLTPTAVSPTEIDLTWTDNSAHAVGYEVFRSDNAGGGFAQVGADLPNSATGFQDTTAPENATSYYIVQCLGPNGSSGGSQTVNAATPIAAPASVVAATTTSTTTGDKTITLSWSNLSTVAISINIERSSGGDYSPLATVAATDTSYADDTALENTTYTYRVYAVAGQNTSPHSASNSVTTLLSRPIALSLSSPTASTVALTWTDISSAAGSYHIERSLDGTNFSEVGSVLSGAANSYNDTGLTEGTQYYYRVRAASDSNTSNYADVQSITTIPATPSGLTVTPFSTTELDLTWTDTSPTNTGYIIERSNNGGQSWTPVSNVLVGTDTTFSDTGLTEGSDYEYELIATGVGGSSAASTEADGTTLPAAPSGITLAASSASSVTINWTDNSTGATSYEVQRSIGGAWTTLASALPGNADTFTDTTVAEGTAYQYQVRAARNGSESTFAAALGVTTQPAVPTALAVSSISSTRVTLTWTDNSNGETSFTVERSTNGGGYAVVGTPGANSTTYSDNTVSEGQSYSYYLFASNAGGDSTVTDTVSALIPPAAPSGLASSDVAPTSVTLNWTNHSSHQTGFYVERKTAGVWVQIADVTTGVTYTDTTATEDGTYSYRVRAYGTSGTSGYATSINVTTPLNAPSSLTATPISATELDLTWTDNSHAETGYAVQRSANGGGTWTTVASALSANATSYHDSTLAEGTTYTYQVQATRSGANSAYSPATSAMTLPATPSAVTATAAGDMAVTVAWTNNSASQTGFIIQRSSGGGGWSNAATVGANVFTYTDTGLTELTAYSYRVQATNSGGVSAYANSASSATTLPAAPSNLAVSAPAADQVLLSWHDNSSGATGYKVERSINGVDFTQIALLGASATTYFDQPVNEATTYTYRVRAVANSLNSAFSPTAALTTVPASPDTLVATTISSSEIDLAWNNNSAGATHYLVEQSTDGGVTFVQIASLGADANSYQNTLLAEDTDYQFQVRAQDAGGFSDYTNSAEAITLLNTPTNLVGVAHGGHTDLTWTNHSTQDTDYTVMRSDDNGLTWNDIADLGAGATSFSDTGDSGGLNSGQSYQYRVFCSDANDGSISANSNTAIISAI